MSKVCEFKERNLDPPDDNYTCSCCQEWDECGFEYDCEYYCRECYARIKEEELALVYICPDCDYVCCIETETEICKDNMRRCWDCLNIWEDKNVHESHCEKYH